MFHMGISVLDYLHLVIWAAKQEVPTLVIQIGGFNGMTHRCPMAI